MATQPSLRIGDRERDAVAAELQEHYAHGRLSLEEFNQRVDAVFAAKTQSDLSRITVDLPHVRSTGTPLPAPRSGRAPRPITGPSGGWSGQDQGQSRGGRVRGSLALFSTLIAVLASWLIVADFLPGLRFFPSRLGILLAIFAVLRGLLRRVFGGGRGMRCCGRGRRPW
ncbi:MAG: DUF1707 domain-containing protein [Streptosporangiaceae bacterium]